MQRRFEVNLANHRGDIILHVNPRLNDRVLVLNSAPGGGWGGEDRKPLNINRGHPFSMIIMVTPQCFKVKYFCFKKDYSHNQLTYEMIRLPLTISIQLIFLIVCHLTQQI